MVNRLIEPTSGRILLDGVDAATRDVTELRRGIGYVIQQVGLFPHQTIGDNVGTVPRLLGWPAARVQGPLGGAPGARRARSGEVRPALSERAVGRRAPAGRRGPGPGRRSADHAHGRAVRGGRSDRPRAAPGRVPAAPAGAGQDDPVRDPRHRRGDQDGRPRRRLPGRRPGRPVRHAPGAAGHARIGLRGPLRRRRPRPEAALAQQGPRSRAPAGRQRAARRAGRRGSPAGGPRPVPVPPPGRRGGPAASAGCPIRRSPARAS